MSLRAKNANILFGPESLLLRNLDMALSAIFLTSSPYDDDDGEETLPNADIQKFMQGSVMIMI